MKITSFEDLLILKLKALYDIEHEITKSLPKVIKNVSNEDLRSALEDHLDETYGQEDRLEQAFGMLGEKAQKTKVEGIRGIVEDGIWVMDQDMPEELNDAALVGNLRYIEQYEIAGYSTAISWARQLGNDDIADLLEESLSEEQATDGMLMTFVEEAVNVDLISDDSAEE